MNICMGRRSTPVSRSANFYAVLTALLRAGITFFECTDFVDILWYILRAARLYCIIA